MRLGQSRLARKERNAQRPAFDSAQQFNSNSVVQLPKVHRKIMWKTCCQKWEGTDAHCLQKSQSGANPVNPEESLISNVGNCLFLLQGIDAEQGCS